MEAKLLEANTDKEKYEQALTFEFDKLIQNGADISPLERFLYSLRIEKVGEYVINIKKFGSEDSKVQNELSTNIETDLEIIKRKYRELQEAGFIIYNDSEEEMRIMVMNSAGEWESPEELKFKTKSATRAKFDELKKEKAVHISLKEKSLEDFVINFYYFRDLQEAGFTIYRDSISEMRIKLMNENGSWTSPKELQFSTQEEAQAKWRELMMQPKTLSN